MAKLVRDRIPEIIRARGAVPIVRIASAEEYREALRAKLSEETDEVLAAKETDVPDELADVLEVVLAFAADIGIDADQLEKIRAEKVRARGGFGERIMWEGNATA